MRLVRLGGTADAEARFERGNARRERFLLGARFGGHGLHGVELLAPNQIHSGEDTLELIAQTGLELIAYAGERAKRASGDAGEIVEQAVLGLHGGFPFLSREWQRASG